MQIVVMYHNNFLQQLKEKRNKKQLYKLELIAKEINKNTYLKKLSVFVLANLLYCEKALASTDDILPKVDNAGWKLLNISRSIGYWVCIIMGINEIIRNLLQGDTKTVAKIMMKYSLVFAALYIFPWILDIIKDIF